MFWMFLIAVATALVLIKLGALSVWVWSSQDLVEDETLRVRTPWEILHGHKTQSQSCSSRLPVH